LGVFPIKNIPINKSKEGERAIELLNQLYGKYLLTNMDSETLCSGILDDHSAVLISYTIEPKDQLSGEFEETF
jgi:hypothetical protein